MCGIAGFFSTQYTFSRAELQLMTQAIAHRGPDAAGDYFDDICGLGHRRLSILDLSEKANQPMASQNNRYSMVFNGEVYNFLEIADALQLTLNTSSDSEVILEAFSKQHAAFVQLLNGMFALAIYDKQEKELFLFRDRLGIKPLFYFWDGTKFAFASELKAILQLSGISTEINKQAITQFLHLGYIPAPHTIYKYIFKALPGSYIKVSANGLTQHCYWKTQTSILPSAVQDEHTAQQELNALLQSSVRYQLISDVPLGVFLSGGIDSSMVTALAANQSNTPLNTFSIGFEDHQFNEAKYARMVAKHLQTQHQEFIVSAAHAKELVEPMLDLYDEPYADSSAIPMMLVSQLARKYVKVVLCGDGADELFFGYGMYVWAKRLDFASLHFFKKPIQTLLKQGKQVRYQKAADMLDYTDRAGLKNHIFSQEQGFFSEKELPGILQGDYYKYGKLNDNGAAYMFEKFSGSRQLNAMEEQALFDIQFYLPDDLLVKVDRATMKYGLEARVPFLDHRVVEYALNLSPDLKYNGGTTKYLLKKILFELLPVELFNRPKQGFSIPLHEWLRTDLRYLLDDYLNEQVVRQIGIVQYNQVEKLKESFLSGNNYFYNRLWVLIVLHRFMLKNRLAL